MPPHAQKSKGKGKGKATEPIPPAEKSTTTVRYENGATQITLDFPQGD
jgi:hypothetical protein